VRLVPVLASLESGIVDHLLIFSLSLFVLFLIAVPCYFVAFIFLAINSLFCEIHLVIHVFMMCLMSMLRRLRSLLRRKRMTLEFLNISIWRKSFRRCVIVHIVF